eukprot:6948748-Heterocapsa_arctica.AAC.1
MIGLLLRRVGEGLLIPILGAPGLMVKRLMESFPFPVASALILLPLLLDPLCVGSGCVVEHTDGQDASSQPAENTSLPKRL